MIATHNPGKLREMRELLAAVWDRRRVGGRARPGRARGDRHELRARTPASRRSAAATASRPAGLCRQFRADGRRARRRARHLFGALGRPEQGFRGAPCGRSRTSCARAAPNRTSARAHFVSALCVAWPDGHVEEFEAKVDGTLVWPPRGDKGFGYDPMFLPDGHALTFGEMSARGEARPAAEGNGLSHRARAFPKLAEACLGQR